MKFMRRSAAVFDRIARGYRDAFEASTLVEKTEREAA